MHRKEDSKSYGNRSRNKKNSIGENKTTSKTKPNELMFTSDKEYLNRLKEKRSSAAESNLRSYLPGDNNNGEDDNLLSTFKNTFTNDSKSKMSKSKRRKRVSIAISHSSYSDKHQHNGNLMASNCVGYKVGDTAVKNKNDSIISKEFKINSDNENRGFELGIPKPSLVSPEKDQKKPKNKKRDK